MPTAPFILASSCTAAICARARCRRATTLAISLPTVVGLAVWPCVRLSIGTSASACARASSLSDDAVERRQQHLVARGRSISAWLVLLMSSLVHAKCTNSAAAASAGWLSAAAVQRDLSQYSTALTSWLVVASMSLIACASASEKRSTSPRSSPRAASLNGGSSAKPASDSAMNHSTSTCTRRCMRPNSLSSGRSAATLAA